MTKSIAVFSMKGGVGKTTIAANLAYCATENSSSRTLLWDLDAQGAASFLFKRDQPASKAKRIFSRDLEPADMVVPTQWPRLDVLAADISLRHLDQILSDAAKPKRLRKLMQALAPAYEYIVVDCPPSLSELSDQIFRAVDLIVVPVPPSPLAMRSLVQVEDHLERYHDRKPRIFPVISMVDRRKRMHREFLDDHPDWLAIPHASTVERMAVERAPVVAYDRRSPAASALLALWDDIQRNLAAMPDSREKAAAGKLVRIPSGAR